MGAGRSGTTALATFLGSNKDILTIGEMHQFFEHIEENKRCACGDHLETCRIWSGVLQNLPEDFIEKAADYRSYCARFEYHSSLIDYITNRFSNEESEKYLYIAETVFTAISKANDQKYLLDSAKYIGRAIGLGRSDKINLRIIYVIRDVRGVIHSFSKNVQSPRNPLSTIFYYLMVNIAAEFIYICTPKNKIIKIKYEDFVEEPLAQLERLEGFLELDLEDIKNNIINNRHFNMCHIIGGNRLKTNKSIYLEKHISWKSEFSSFKKYIYYILASPIMLLNKFKI